jgi:hypothetical protein
MESTRFFKFVSLALIVYMTPALTFFTRGIIGFVGLIFVALIFGLSEKCFHDFAGNIRSSISNNKVFSFLAVWYALGAISNIFLGGGGFSDWRLLVDPVLLLIGFSFSLGLYHNDRCYRLLQIALLLVSGAQAAYSYVMIVDNPGIARTMFFQTQGAWAGGNPNSFAVYAILLPLFLWRAFSERGVIRSVLIAANVMIFASLTISTLAAPLSLLFVGASIISLLVIVFPPSRRGYFVTLVIVALLMSTTIYAYNFSRDIAVLGSVYYRVDNFLEDPTSGGYSGVDLDQSRWDKILFSISSFNQAPLLGMGEGSLRSNRFVGGHSSMFDSLGGYGLLGGGGALCALMFVMLVKSLMRFRREGNWESLLAGATVALLVVAGIVNPYWESFQPVIVFFMARPLLDKNALIFGDCTN